MPEANGMTSIVRHPLVRAVFVTGVALLAGCGPAKKSVFPPSLTLQEVSAKPGGTWHVTLRVHNNSYGGMSFDTFQGTLRVGDLGAVLLDAKIDQDIPSFAADVATIDLLPTAEMSKALAALAAKGSAGALPYSIDGHVTATPEKEDKAQTFPVHGKNWLSPVPGIPDTYRSP
ncbi:hypothetical protein SAMN02800691_2267 [Luteibacter sp. UNCMF366Tsu5.1]|nr:hypothetical protein SAMN02800691_2267 [Luteibacter sp. UNCMF366Tsu5.1]